MNKGRDNSKKRGKEKNVMIQSMFERATSAGQILGFGSCD